jgi:Kef-type K+ transport system membrane component KefB
MSITEADLARLLVAVGVLMIGAHTLGHVFARFRQPPVIGEILAGILLGPTLLGHVAPGVEDWIFPTEGSSATVLGAVYQLGLLLLMFCAGAQMRGLLDRRLARSVGAIAAIGMVLPFAAGLAAVKLLDTRPYEGPNAVGASFLLVFSLAIAVTSIPVISRIMFDLGLLETRFARVVLAVAVIEDIVVYIVLAVALGIAGGKEGNAFGLAGTLGFEPGSAANSAYYAIATLTFLGASLAFAPFLYRKVMNLRYNAVRRRSPIGFQLVFMIAMAGAALALSIVPLFGAFVAGIVASTARGRDAVSARASITNFSMAFFIPVYFAVVGLKLDLVHHFAPLFFLGFLVFGCVAKAGSVYLGARVGGESRLSARNLAIAMNARGGPGIVLASVAFDAGIVNETMYAVLVMLAIVTSLAAGAWLDRVAPSLREDTRLDDAAAAEPAAQAL